MKGFAVVAAVVVAVIAIGAGLVGGLSLPTQTYGQGAMRFSIAFPTALGWGNSIGPGLQREEYVGYADDGKLDAFVFVFPPIAAHGLPLSTEHGAVTELVRGTRVVIGPLQCFLIRSREVISLSPSSAVVPGERCTDVAYVATRNLLFEASALSTEGPSLVRQVVGSLRASSDSQGAG